MIRDDRLGRAQTSAGAVTFPARSTACHPLSQVTEMESASITARAVVR